MTTYADAIRHALNLAAAALNADDLGAVRTWSSWARYYADEAYRAAPIRDADGLAAALGLGVRDDLADLTAQVAALAEEVIA
jgi:hypothetical protein